MKSEQTLSALALSGALAMLIASPAVQIQGQHPVPMGNQFQVNTYTTSQQEVPAVAVDPDGNYLVVWRSDPTGIRAQRYAQDGAPIGDEFGVSLVNGSENLSVAADGTGDFTVVWDDYDVSTDKIYGQRFGSDGAPIGDDFQINTYVGSYQWAPSVAADTDGDFVVVWSAYNASGGDTDNTSVQGQRFALAGAVGGEFQVNTYTTNSQVDPAVAIAPDGNFVVVWESRGSSGSDNDPKSIQGQRYGSDGTALGDEFQINTYTTSYQHNPAVAVAPDGDFVVVWESFGSSGSDHSAASIQGQRYASDGTALGAQFQVNTYTTYSQDDPSVTVASDGDFIVVWRRSEWGGTLGNIHGQCYASDGTARGEEFQVNTYTTGSQWIPVVAADPTGDFLIVWQSVGSSGSDTSGWSIQGQRFLAAVDLSISKDDAVTQATPGRSVIYTIVASNSTPIDVPSVSVTDSFPDELTCSWTSGATGGATGNTSSSGDLNDTVNMPAGSSVTYTVTCAIDPAATGTLSNTAMISSPYIDDQLANNNAIDDDTVLVPEADLSVTQVDAPDPVNVRDALAYTIQVSNLGPSREPLVLVTDVLPPEASFVGVDATGWLCSHFSGSVTCTRSILDVGSAPAITLTLSPPAYETVITNHVGVSGTEIDPDSGNNSSAETTTVEGLIFVDGFESGDTSAWSSTLP